MKTQTKEEAIGNFTMINFRKRFWKNQPEREESYVEADKENDHVDENAISSVTEDKICKINK